MISIGSRETVSPQTFRLDFEDIEDDTSSMRMANGEYRRDVVATKRTLSLEWKALRWGEVSAIMSGLSTPFVEITYPDSMSGMIETREFYVKRRSSPVAFMQEDEDGVDTFYWENVGVVLEER